MGYEPGGGVILGRKEKGRLFQNWRCLAAAGSAPGAGFLLTNTHRSCCNPSEKRCLLQQEETLLQALFG